MTKQETTMLFALIKSLFPWDDSFKNATPDMVVAWAEMLEDIPFDHAKAAIKASVAASKFPPSIADIRDYATRLRGPKRMTAEEAWGIASELIRTYGDRTVRVAEPEPDVEQTKEQHYREYRFVAKPRPSGIEYEAKLHCPDDEVWGILKRMGYKDVCNSENPDVCRGQFMRAWTSHDQEALELRVVGPIVPELVNGIAGEIVKQLTERKKEANGDS